MIDSTPLLDFVIYYQLWLLPNPEIIAEKDPDFINRWVDVIHTAPYYAVNSAWYYASQLEYLEENEGHNFIKDKAGEDAFVLKLDEDDVFDEVLVAVFDDLNIATYKRLPRDFFYENFKMITEDVD